VTRRFRCPKCGQAVGTDAQSESVVVLCTHGGKSSKQNPPRVMEEISEVAA
jgi:transcription elongation factor Elf1